jgi:sialate O-acetylesterase
VKLRCAALVFALLPCAAPAAGLLADVFQDHVVLQRDADVPVWGEAEPGARVNVRFADEEAETVAGDDGRWRLELPARAAGGPYTLTVQSGEQSQRVDDVLVGDVWLCSGQSNMEFPLRLATNADYEIGLADDDGIRLLKVPRRSSLEPLTELPSGSRWQVSSPESAPGFSAVCQFMGRTLRAKTEVPVGLIDASWGGSIIEDWIAADTLAAAGGFEGELEVRAAYARSPEEGLAAFSDLMRAWSDQRDPGAAAGWSSPDFNDRNWPEIDADGFWEDAGIPVLTGFDGTLWYRKTFEVTAEQAAREGVISLGPADDIDTTFINGVEVGVMSGWDTPRQYTVPAGTLREGRNVLAVRVTDTGGGGGLWGSPEERRIEFGDAEPVSLAGPWRYRRSATLDGSGSPPRAPWVGGSGLATIADGMLASLAPMRLAGIAWYQGESNVSDAADYARLQALLAEDLRERFASPDAPFVLAQLASFGALSSSPGTSAWAALRDAQRRAAADDPHMAMAVIADVGDVHDIHPTQKRIVGERMAREVLFLYENGTSPAAGTTSPAPVSTRMVGNHVVVAVATTYPPLQTVASDGVVGIELCESRTSCAFASARLAWGSIIVDVPAGMRPTLVRYGWADSPLLNVYDDTMAPMTPFEMPIAE